MVLSADAARLTNLGSVTGSAFLNASNSISAQVINHGVMVASGSAYSVYLNSGTFHNHGTISAKHGVQADGAVEIDNTGLMTFTGNAFLLGGNSVNHTLTNTGRITADTGVYIGQLNEVSVFNSGVIECQGEFFLRNVGAGRVDVVNHGEIIGRITATDAGEIDLINTGTITGNVRSLGANAEDSVRNSGTIIGDLELYGANDLYDGRGGVVTGQIYGGTGDDTLISGSAGERVIGGSDNDIIEGRGGDDTLYGESGFDTLFGGNGSDYLNGGNKIDVLNGGAGDDTLVGGGGADDFVFDLKAGDDVITDFAVGSDDIDLSAFDLTGFAALQASGAISENGTSVTINLNAIGGKGSIRLEGVLEADLSAGDFIF